MHQRKPLSVFHTMILIFFLLFITMANASTLKANPSLMKSTMESSAETNRNKQQEREQLYEAYNLLHTLAQVLLL